MKKANFNTLKNLPVPEEWLEKALSVPMTEKKKPLVPLFRRRAMIAAAAFVAVSALSITLFFTLRKAPLSLAYAPSVTEPSPPNGYSVPTERETQKAEETAPFDKEPADAPTDGSNITEPVTEPSRPNEKPDPTSVPDSVVPSEKPTDMPNTAQTDPPQKPTAPIRPESTRPDAPTDPPIVSPSVPPTDCEFYGTFSSKTIGAGAYNIEEDLTLFCRLYDSGGNIVGDAGEFSPQRVATIISENGDGTFSVMYDPVENGFTIACGVYEYEFYDIQNNILYHGVKNVK